MKEDYEECVIGDHREYREKSLTEFAQLWLSSTHNFEFSKEASIGWSESFEDKDDFSITCKYERDSDDIIIEYTVEDGKLVSIDAKTYDGYDNSVEIHEQVEIKYSIQVDAYDKYDYHVNI